MNIRDERPADRGLIEALTYRAFENHPHHAPGAKPTEHLILNRLRDSGALTLSLVAEDDGIIVGQIAFSPVTLDGRACGWFGLGPVSVAPERQGTGIGSELIRQGLERMRDLGAEGVVLLGDPAYYGRFGFRADPGLVFPGVPPEYFVALRLREETAVPAGVIGFDEAFG